MCEIDIEKRFDGHIPTEGIFKDISMIIDGTDIPIDRPYISKTDRQIFFSGRKKENARSKYNFKYTVGVQITNGTIVFIDGPECGSKSDIRILRESEVIGFIIDRNPFEIVLGDKGYQGMPNVLTPFKDPTADQDAFNQVIASVRQIVECTLQRIKIFGILGERGRYRQGCIGSGIEKHKKNIQRLLSNNQHYIRKRTCLDAY